MTHAEIIAAAREIVAAQNDNNFERVDNRSWKYGLDMAIELVRLHDGGEWSSEPPIEPGDWWWRETMESKPVYLFVYMADIQFLYQSSLKPLRCVELFKESRLVSEVGGFWLSAEPATATMLAELRAENDRLRKERDDWENLETEVQFRLQHSERELAEAKAELAMWKPLTADEAKAALDEAESVPLPDERIKEIVAFATDPANKLPNNEQAQLAAANKRLRAELETACKWIYGDHVREFASGECKPDCPRCLVERVRKAERRPEKVAAEPSRRPWDRSLDEICPVHGGPCGQCPLPERLEAKP